MRYGRKGRRGRKREDVFLRQNVMTKEHEEKVENEKRDEIEGEFYTGRGVSNFHCLVK